MADDFQTREMLVREPDRATAASLEPASHTPRESAPHASWEAPSAWESCAGGLTENSATTEILFIRALCFLEFTLDSRCHRWQHCLDVARQIEMKPESI